jgi:hypothetical protein
MKRQLKAALILCFVIGTGAGAAIAAEEPTGGARVSKEAREAIEATKLYTAEQKEAFQRKAHEELVSIQTQITVLQAKVSDASASTRMELQRSLMELERKKETARDKLDELRVATGAKWNGVKSGFSAALEELHASYRKALAHLP